MLRSANGLKLGLKLCVAFRACGRCITEAAMMTELGEIPVRGGQPGEKNNLGFYFDLRVVAFGIRFLACDHNITKAITTPELWKMRRRNR